MMTSACFTSWKGLVSGHAYTVLGTKELRNEDGSLVHRLVEVRNPWSSEMYRGPWSDKDTKLWTEEFRAQANPSGDLKDGRFYMALDDFKKGFTYFTITYYHDDFHLSYLEETNYKAKKAYEYEFTIKKTQEVFVAGQIYPNRMYPFTGCSRPALKFSLELKQGSKSLAKMSFTSQKGYGNLRVEPLEAGTYTLVMTGSSAPSNAVNDFTVNVYAKEKVKIRAKGQTRDQDREEREEEKEKPRPRPRPQPEPKPQPKPDPRPDPVPIIDVQKYD